MKLSIIIPIYNAEYYIEQCLDSIINQSFQDYEIICINDSSTDSSGNIIDEYKRKHTKIRAIHNKKNQGMGKTRNIGTSLAKGEYIHFVDADDWLEPNTYQNLISIMSNNPQIDILCLNYKMYNNKTNNFTLNKYAEKKYINKIVNALDNYHIYNNWDRMAWLKIIKSDFLKKNNILFEEYISRGDVEWAAKLYACNPYLYFSDIIGYNYRTNIGNSLVDKSLNYIKQDVEAFIKNRELYKKLPDEIKYRMLGADYFLLTGGLPNAYKNGIINTFELWDIIHKINISPEYKKYIMESYKIYHTKTDRNLPLILSFEKIFLKTNFPHLFNLLVKINNVIK